MTSNKVPMSCNATMGPMCDCGRVGGRGLRTAYFCSRPCTPKKLIIKKYFGIWSKAAARTEQVQGRELELRLHSLYL